jgi:L,D-transpeptidase catalytic domain
MLQKLIVIFSFCLLSFNANAKSSFMPSKIVLSTMSTDDKLLLIDQMYYNLNANHNSLPKIECFSKGLLGFYNLKERGKVKKDILTIIDYSLPSSKKRLWVIDLENNKVLFNTLVAHGVNSGTTYAKRFSNKVESNQSSLGFFSTGESYVGKHGLSMKLDGLEKGINNKARMRDVVIHGADYVSPAYIKSNKLLGRSQGCPALPHKFSKKIIKVIKNRSCLFIYNPDKTYFKKTKIV